ncbi:MAG: ethanolamine ammonia-lyase subunit EutC [Xanthobacteraceae bacterium]|nr:ethanolamine ammonia-lyase subunit EutC [Xanthobacteraceae bacterium]
MSKDERAVHSPHGALRALRERTEARIALGRSGAGVPTRAAQRFLLDHARAREAVWSALDAGQLSQAIARHGFALEAAVSAATTRAEYLRRPDLGRRLSAESRRHLASLGSASDVVAVVADGLSATAVQLNAAPLLAVLKPRFDAAGLSVGPVVLASQARVALGDEIGHALGAKAVLVLVGERPGLSASDSLGVYITYGPEPGLPDSRRNCISNIRAGGLNHAAAAEQIFGLLQRMLVHKTSGVMLGDEASIAAALAASDRPPGST